MMEGLEIERYEKQINEDFKVFIINKRFIQLEKSWIRDISHKVMSKNNYFIHNDRKKLRKRLFHYLNTKIKEFDLRGKNIKKGIKT